MSSKKRKKTLTKRSDTIMRLPPIFHLSHVLKRLLPILDFTILHLIAEHGRTISIGLRLPRRVVEHESVLPVPFAGITNDNVFVAAAGIFHEMIEAFVRGAATLVVGDRAFVGANSNV